MSQNMIIDYQQFTKTFFLLICIILSNLLNIQMVIRSFKKSILS